MINQYSFGLLNCIVFILSYKLFQNRDIKKSYKTVLNIVFGFSFLFFVNDALFNAIGCISITICITMITYLLFDKTTFVNKTITSEL